MPYLTFATLTQPSNISHPEKIPMENSTYRQLLEAYSGKIVHGSRTLDEACYHSLSKDDLEARNRDQVATKWILSQLNQRLGKVEIGSQFALNGDDNQRPVEVATDSMKPPRTHAAKQKEATVAGTII